jgi:hypothetical protein
LQNHIVAKYRTDEWLQTPIRRNGSERKEEQGNEGIKENVPLFACSKESARKS